MTTSSGDNARSSTAHNRRYGAKGCRSVRLSVGQALRTRLKIYVRTLLLLLYFSACRGWPLLHNKRTPIVPVFFGHASKLIYEEGVSSSPRFRLCTDIPVIIFSKKCKNFLTKFERAFSWKFRDSYFSRKFVHEKRFPHIALGFFLTDLEGVIHSPPCLLYTSPSPRD